MFSTQTNRNDPSYDLSKHSVHNSIDEGLVQAPNYRYPHTLTFLNDFTAEAEAQIIQNFEALNSRAGKVILPNLKTLRDSFCVSRVNDRTMAESGVEMKDGTEDSPYLNLMDNDHTFDENDVWLVVERQQTEGWFIYIKDLLAMGLNHLVDRIWPVPRDLKAPLQPKDRERCLRNGGGLRSFLPPESDVYDSASDTEPDDEETCKGLEKRFPPPTTTPRWIPQDHETVYGKDVVIARSFGGTLHAFVDERTMQETKSETKFENRG